MRYALLLAAVLCLAADAAFGKDKAPPTLEEPPALEDLLAFEPPSATEPAFAGEKRRAAMRAAALAFGAQAGLARRGREIAGLLERHADRLSDVYRFRALTLRAHGFTVMPPVLAETSQAFRLGRDGTRAATASRVLRILEPERIVSAPPHWRDFLIRAWPEPAPPASVLFPRDEEETVLWREWLRDGWARGTALAEDVFAADLDRLARAFEGLVRWRHAHLARMVSAPVLHADRAAVSGNDRLMRIDETAAVLGEPARFDLRAEEWRVLPLGDAP